MCNVYTAWAINSLITRFPADLLEYFIVMLLFIKFGVRSCSSDADVFFSLSLFQFLTLSRLCLRCCFCRDGDSIGCCCTLFLDCQITFSHSHVRPIIIPLNWRCCVPCHRRCSTLLARIYIDINIYFIHWAFTVNEHTQKMWKIVKWSDGRKSRRAGIHCESIAWLHNKISIIVTIRSFTRVCVHARSPNDFEF